MRTVVTYGSFDLLHTGHMNLLRRARELGDRLVVYVSSDRFNKVKGKTCAQTEYQRAINVLATGLVNEVGIEHAWHQKRTDLQALKNPILVMGSDWVDKFTELEDIATVVYLPRTKGISSTMLRKSADNNKEKHNTTNK